jgi:hypothetical protein
LHSIVKTKYIESITPNQNIYIMRKSLIILFCLVSWSASAQWGFGFRGGVSTTSVNGKSFNVLNQAGVEELNLALKDANYGLHAGVVFYYQKRAFIFQPEILFNTATAEYSLSDLGTPGGRTEILEERFNTLDIPVLLGLRVGPIHLHGGPVGHVFLSNTSDLEDIDGFQQDFESLTLGYQLGIGLDIWNLAIDVRYEGNFTEYGDQIRFGNTAYNFDDQPARWLFSLAWIFYDDSDDDDDN